MNMIDFPGWTTADVLSMAPCHYYRRCLEDLWDGRERLSIKDVCRLDITAKDRMWLLVRTPRPVIVPALERIQHRTVRKYALPDSGTHEWAKAWFRTGDPGPTPDPSDPVLHLVPETTPAKFAVLCARAHSADFVSVYAAHAEMYALEGRRFDRRHPRIEFDLQVEDFRTVYDLQAWAREFMKEKTDE